MFNPVSKKKEAPLKTCKWLGGRIIVFVAAVLMNLAAATTGWVQSEIEWTRTYGSDRWEDGYSVQPTQDGGYIITGDTDSFGAVGRDVYLIKTAANGDTLWTRRYGGADTAHGYCVQQTTDQGYIVSGDKDSFGGGVSDVYVIKTDSEGNTQRTLTYGGTGSEFGRSVRQTTPDGGLIIAGDTYSFGAGALDVYLIKTNAIGDTLWTRTYGGEGFEHGYSVQQTSDNGYIIAGDTDSYGAGGYDVYLVKTDSAGDTLWTRTYGEGYHEAGSSVQQTTDGGYIIAGEIWEPGAVDIDVYLIKTDSTGQALWIKRYGGDRSDRGWSVQQTAPDGGFIIAGESASYSVDNVDAYLIKTDESGDTLWTRTIGGNSFDNVSSIYQTTDTGYIAVGTTYSFGAGQSDVWLIKLGPDPSVGVSQENPQGSELPRSRFLHQNYPNPFNPSTTITFDINGMVGVKQAVNLTIYDIRGRRVRTLIDSDLQPGSYTIHWDGRNDGEEKVASGIYLYTLRAGEERFTRKMTVLK